MSGDPRKGSEEKERSARGEVVPTMHPNRPRHVDVLYFVDLIDPMTGEVERERAQSERAEDKQHDEDAVPGSGAHLFDDNRLDGQDHRSRSRTRRLAHRANARRRRAVRGSRLRSLRGRPRLLRGPAARRDGASPTAIAAAVAPSDIVVGAVPGFLGHAMLRTVIDAGKPIADISFAPEDPLPLDALAKGKGVPAVVDCGVSPGLSNLACGRAASRLEEIDSIVISVGGLPFRRVPPWEYRIVFSATDVIEEYTRPACLVEDGEIVTRPALSEVTRFDVPGVGTLEAFLTDGLRTVLSTVKARNLREQTLRWPGHAEKMRLLRDTGFLRDEPVEAGGARVSPR